MMRQVLMAAFVLAALPMTRAIAQKGARDTVSDQVKAKFVQADKNKDGVLTLDEWTAAGRRERGFRFIDADHDGKITPAELQSAIAAYGFGR